MVAPMTYNRIYTYVHTETWKSINKIVKNRALTLLYRGDFTDMEYDDAILRLKQSWSRVDFEAIEGGTERAILINLVQ